MSLAFQYDVATAGRRRGLNTMYIRHKLFHRSNPRRDVDFQNKHIVFLKSPYDVIQVCTVISQLRLRPEIADWYRDAKSVPCGHFLIDLSSRTEDRLDYCANTGSNLVNFYNLDRLKQSKVLDNEHTKYLYSPIVPKFFPKCQSLFFWSCPKVFIKFFFRLLGKSAQRKPAKHEKNMMGQKFKAIFDNCLQDEQLANKKERFWKPKNGSKSKSS